MNDRLQFIKNRVEYNQSYKYISMNERRPNLEVFWMDRSMKVQLVSIESMIGTQSEYAILGYIYHNSRDELLIEDLNGKVRLNADKAVCECSLLSIAVSLGALESTQRTSLSWLQVEWKMMCLLLLYVLFFSLIECQHILQPQFESREQSMTFLSQLQLLGLSNSSNV